MHLCVLINASLHLLYMYNDLCSSCETACDMWYIYLRCHWYHTIKVLNQISMHVHCTQYVTSICVHSSCYQSQLVTVAVAVGRFLLEWMPEFVTLGKPVNFVSLLVNFVHYNAAFLDQDVLVGLVQ